MRSWALRMGTWLRLMSEVRGATARDGCWLWLSFLASPITAMFALSEWRDPLLLHNMVADVPGVGHFQLRARTDDLWHVVPFRERIVLECIRSRLRPGDCFVDAGANIGFYTIVGARLVGPSGTVVAIEMMDDTARILRSHLELNSVSNARVIERALSARDNETVVASMPTGSFGQASISTGNSGETFEVRSATLDVLLRDTATIRLIKIDIEGAELEALRGASVTLDRVEAIIFEHLDRHALDQIATMLVSRGFRVEPLDGRNSLAFRS